MLLGFIYPGVRVPGKPYVSVNPGKANQTTTFSWNATSYARYYDVYVYKAGESNPTQVQYGVNGTNWSCTLPAGNYRVAVASVNHAQYAYTFSDSVNFTVQAAPVTYTHNYQRVTVKATTTATDIHRSSVAAEVHRINRSSIIRKKYSFLEQAILIMEK